MQPLISPVDHESRHNSYRAEDAHIQAADTENTPLIQRFPPNVSNEVNHRTAAMVSLLIALLLVGVVISIYLLVLQSRADNALTPVESLRIVNRSQWDSSTDWAYNGTSRGSVSCAIVVQTDSRPCYNSEDCIELLTNMLQNSSSEPVARLPYNFLISSSGQAYEVLGWNRASPLFPEYSASALVLGLIGNFTNVAPTPAQNAAARLFVAESVSREHLPPAYKLFGKNTKYKPKYLIDAMSDHSNWDSTLSDS